MILVDTNFILTCVKQKIDLFSQLGELLPCEEIAVPSIVLKELERLSKNKKLKIIEREAAIVAIQLLNKKARVIKMEGEGDDAIISYILKHKGIILASLDIGLIYRVNGKARFLTIKVRKKVAFLE